MAVVSPKSDNCGGSEILKGARGPRGVLCFWGLQREKTFGWLLAIDAPADHLVKGAQSLRLSHHLWCDAFAHIGLQVLPDGLGMAEALRTTGITWLVDRQRLYDLRHKVVADWGI